MLGDPAARRKLLEQGFVELARRPIVDVLDRRLAVPQMRGPQSRLEPLGAAIGGLAVDQQRQPFGVAEIARIVLRFEFDEGARHAVELHRPELVECWMLEHCLCSPQWK